MAGPTRLGLQFGETRLKSALLTFEQADAVGESELPRGNEPRLDHFDLVDQLSDLDFIGHWLSVGTLAAAGARSVGLNLTSRLAVRCLHARS